MIVVSITKKTGVTLAFAFGLAVLAGCGKEKQPAPAPTGLEGAVLNKLAGRTNNPVKVPEVESRTTEELLASVAGAKDGTNAAMGRTFMDGLMEKAAAGDAESMYWLGFYHATGKDVPKNLMEGAKWYQEAAEHNHEKGQYELGVAFEEGLGVPKDPVIAYQWLYLAAQKGNLDAIDRRDKLAAKLPEYEVEKGKRMAELFVPK